MTIIKYKNYIKQLQYIINTLPTTNIHQVTIIHTMVEFILRLEKRITLKLTLFLRINKKLIPNMNRVVNG